MLKQSDVTIINIDDFIRQELADGKRQIHWDEERWEILGQFKKGLKWGDYYLGAYHYPNKGHK